MTAFDFQQPFEAFLGEPPEPVDYTRTEGDGELEHTLIVHPWDGEGDPCDYDLLEVVHPDGCPRYVASEVQDSSFACHVEFIIDNVGLREYFRHVNETPDQSWDRAEPLSPGTYRIEAWQEIYNHFEYGPEYEDGLCLVEESGVGR